jgi:hypothetical protein
MNETNSISLSILVGVIFLILKEIFDIIKGMNTKKSNNPNGIIEMIKNQFEFHEERSRIRYGEIKNLLEDIKKILNEIKNNLL